MKDRAVEMVRPRVVSGPDDPTQSRDAPIQQRRPSAPDERRNQWSFKSDQAGMRASVVLDAWPGIYAHKPHRFTTVIEQPMGLTPRLSAIIGHSNPRLGSPT